MAQGPRAAFALVVFAGAACDGANFIGLGNRADGDEAVQCVVSTSEILDGGPGKDGIPALTEPIMVTPDDPGAAWIDPDDRVIGIVQDGRAIAIPHQLGWGHEIVNISHPSVIAVTYCPLTGSSLVFDRSVVDGDEYGVSGLLFRTNLILYNRSREESLWSQMGRAGICGPEAGTPLPMVAAFDMNWEGWRSLYPETLVPAHLIERGQLFGLYRYPYGDYEESDAIIFPFPSLDTRRPIKERVLGVPGGEASVPGSNSGSIGRPIAFPFSELERMGPVTAAQADLDGRPLVVFWKTEWQGGGAFVRELDGQPLNFLVRDGQILDEETESRWRVDGRAESGPLAGQQLTPVADAYVAFWFAWAEFNRGTEIWTAGR
jgi:hypothetical protein